MRVSLDLISHTVGERAAVEDAMAAGSPGGDDAGRLGAPDRRIRPALSDQPGPRPVLLERAPARDMYISFISN